MEASAKGYGNKASPAAATASAYGAACDAATSCSHGAGGQAASSREADPDRAHGDRCPSATSFFRSSAIINPDLREQVGSLLRIMLTLDPQLRHELDLLVLVLVLLGILLLDRVLVVRLVRDFADRLLGKLRDQVAKSVLPMRIVFIGSL